jgi:hypothetical protein
MAGKYITEKQVRLYMKYRTIKSLTQEASAAKAGISTRSASTIEHNKHHTQKGKKPRSYKTRKSPIDDIWSHEIESMLKKNPELQPKTLLLYLQRTYQDEWGNPIYDDSVLRTLQRRVAYWQAQYGQPKAVIFPQVHLPGMQSLSDFTHMDRDEILINGVVFKHMLYHFRLVYSKWSYIKVIQGGESFQALSEGLQEALMYLGGATQEHRTDSLSAAYKNLSKEAQEDMTVRYQALCAHYGMEPTRNNKGESHENGSVESSHGHLKNRISQELLLRGSKDFDSILSYEQWLQEMMFSVNKRLSKYFVEEQKALKPLPGYKAMDYELLSTKISNLSLIVIKNMTYSVPSRLAGHALTLHLYQHKIEGYLGNCLVMCFERKYRHIHKTRYVIDYRHIIHALIKKPGAFRFCQYRDELLPNESYRQIWRYLDESEPKKVSPKIMLRLLKLAADYDCEYELGEQVLSLIQQKVTWDIEAIECHFNRSNPALPQVPCLQHTLAHYDQFIPNQTGGIHYATV